MQKKNLICASTQIPDSTNFNRNLKLWKSGDFIEISTESYKSYSHKTVPPQEKKPTFPVGDV